ncbi:MAG: mechanosensitive ion channel family protein [Saprospiraceae bacterium]
MNIDYQNYQDQLFHIVPLFFKGLFTLIAGFWGANKLSELVRVSLAKRKIDENIRPFFVSLVNVGLKILVIISVASMFGIETTSFIAVITALAFAVGSALSGSLGHFASGVLILLFKPYKVGDLVKIGEYSGTVEEIQIFNTILLTLDNRKIIIPNGSVTQGSIINISGQGVLRVDVNVYTDIDEDFDMVKRTLLIVTEKCQMIIPEKSTDVLLQESKEGYNHFVVRVWCRSEYYWEVYYFLQENIKKAMSSEAIRFHRPN